MGMLEMNLLEPPLNPLPLGPRHQRRIFWYWVVVRGVLYCLCCPLYARGQDIDSVALVVLRGWSQIPSFYSMMYKRVTFGESLKDKHSCTWGYQGVAVEIKGSIQVRLCEYVRDHAVWAQ